MIEQLAILSRIGQSTVGCALVGLLVFRWLSSRRGTADRFSPSILGLSFLAFGVLSLAAHSATATGEDSALTDPRAWWRLIQSTQFGSVWLCRQALMSAALLALWVRRDPASLAREIFVGIAAALATAFGAASSHAAAADPAWLALMAMAVHMIAVGVWWGGLMPLALTVRWAQAAQFTSVFRRFSRLAATCMAIIVSSGAYLAWVHVASWPPLFGTPYGLLLLLKLALVAVVLALAARLRWYWLDRLADLAADRVASAASRWILVEWIFALAILAVAGVLSDTPPARHSQVVWPFGFRFAPKLGWALSDVQWPVITGGVLAVLGVGLVAGWRARRVRKTVRVAAMLLVGSGATLALPPLTIPAYPDTYRVSGVPYHAVSIAAGADLFSEHCVACHGDGGLGDGPQARALPKPPADLSAPHTADHTAGDMYWWLTHGIPAGAMPGFGDRLDEEARWDLINFLRTFSSGYQARIIRPRIAPEQPWLPAPDFNYVTQSGVNGSLKALRGTRATWLVLFDWPQSRSRLLDLSAALPAVQRAGAELLALPIEALPEEAVRELTLPVSVEGAEEAVRTYMLLRRTLTRPDAGDRAPLPSHIEFLIDRFGYVRARWLPGEAPEWRDVGDVIKQLDALAAEPEILPPPDVHIH